MWKCSVVTIRTIRYILSTTMTISLKYCQNICTPPPKKIDNGQQWKFSGKTIKSYFFCIVDVIVCIVCFIFHIVLIVWYIVYFFNNIVTILFMIDALKLQLFIKKARFKVRPSNHVSIVTCHRRSIELPRLRSLHLCGPFHVLDHSYVRSIPLTSHFTRFLVGIPAAYSVGLPAAVSI